MSDSEGDEMQQLVASLKLFQISYYCQIAAVALLVYDHLLTFAGEVHFVWSRKFSGATVVFALNRYVTLLGKIALPVSTFWWPNQTDKTCSSPIIIVMILTVLAYFITAIFSALRVYAIWDRNWKPFTLVMLVAIVTPTTNIYQYARSFPAAETFPFWGCGEDVALSAAQFAKLSIVTHSCAIAADLLVLVLTWIKTYEIKKIASDLKLQMSLSSLILRDGTLYFVVLLILNVVDLIINESDALFNPMPEFIDVFTCILISRFMLNLREVAHTPEGPAGRRNTTIALSQFTSIEIARPDVIGDLGAPLTYDTHMTGTTNVTRSVDLLTSSCALESHTVDEHNVAVLHEKGGPLGAGLLEIHRPDSMAREFMSIDEPKDVVDEQSCA